MQFQSEKAQNVTIKRLMLVQTRCWYLSARGFIQSKRKKKSEEEGEEDEEEEEEEEEKEKKPKHTSTYRIRSQEFLSLFVSLFFFFFVSSFASSYYIVYFTSCICHFLSLAFGRVSFFFVS